MEGGSPFDTSPVLMLDRVVIVETEDIQAVHAPCDGHGWCCQPVSERFEPSIGGVPLVTVPVLVAYVVLLQTEDIKAVGAPGDGRDCAFGVFCGMEIAVRAIQLLLLVDHLMLAGLDWLDMTP